MSKIGELSGRALSLAAQMGDGIKDAVPGKAMQWIETGAALGAARTGARVATKFVRRNPAMAIAMAAGAGLLLYAARRKARSMHDGNGDAIEGTATRVEAKRGNGTRRKTAGTTARKRTRPASTAH